MSFFNIIIYSTKTGKEPFSDWEESLDLKVQIIVASRLDRIRFGNFGDCKSIKNGDGVKELRIDYGPGYRIYFGTKGTTTVILLAGGEKKSQSRDIEKAKRYWHEFKKGQL